MKTLLLFVVLGVACNTGRVSAQLADPPSPAPTPSPLVSDVLKLVHAKVDENVILAFVQASGRKASVSASDIIDLRAQGVSSEIQLALLHPGQAQTGAPLPTEPVAPPSNAPAGEATQLSAVANPPDPVYLAPPTEYVSVAEPVYVGVGSAYYPYDDGWYGIGWGLGWGLGWWGWNSCYAYGYPWYGYGCGYGYHCGYVYPGCGSGYGHNGGHVHVDPNATGNPIITANSLNGKTGRIGNAAGSSQQTAGGQGAVSRLSSPTAASGSGKVGGQPKAVQSAGQAKVAPASNHQGVGPASQVSSATRSTVSRSVVGNSSNPTTGTQAGTRVGAQVNKSAATAAYRTGQPGAPSARTAVQSTGTRVAQPSRTVVRSSTVSGPSSVSTRTPSRTSTSYSSYSGASGARNFSSSSGYAGRSTGFSGASSAPSRGFSGSSSGASHSYSGGGSRGGFSGFSGSRGGGSFSGGGGGGRR